LEAQAYAQKTAELVGQQEDNIVPYSLVQIPGLTPNGDAANWPAPA
jgi:hypothetical protein